jgi:hypothetical protein
VQSKAGLLETGSAIDKSRMQYINFQPSAVQAFAECLQAVEASMLGHRSAPTGRCCCVGGHGRLAEAPGTMLAGPA